MFPFHKIDFPLQKCEIFFVLWNFYGNYYTANSKPVEANVLSVIFYYFYCNIIHIIILYILYIYYIYFYCNVIHVSRNVFKPYSCICACTKIAVFCLAPGPSDINNGSHPSLSALQTESLLLTHGNMFSSSDL